jgi:hypothetical protein
MATITAPTDGRPQFSFLDLAISNHLFGGPSLDQVQQIAGDRYILPNAWPQPQAASGGGGFSSAVAASPAQETTKPRSAGQALWPHLP